jgi:hypothetical protein
MANADPTYGVMNAEGGIYWRSGPDWNTPEAVAGNGFYPNTVIAIHCYQSGAGDVPGSTDSMWEQASVVGGSGSGGGWVNEHFINDGQPINQPSPGVPPCGSAPVPPSPSPAPSSPPASSGLVFSVFNAEEGIYYRSSPSWGDTARTPGVGVYNGDRVELICSGFGDPVGPYSDTAWSKVRNLTRPTIGEGWVNEHFINDGAPAGGFVSGERSCGITGGSPPASPSGPKSVFYSPNQIPTGVSGLPAVADLDLVEDEWAEGNCSTAGATNIPVGVNTLAGWSKGRLGPVYFLKAAPAARVAEVHRIVLFDPGSAKNMQEGCDVKFDINGLLAGWLRSNPSNHLVVFTGHDSEEHEFYDWGKDSIGGLWHYYFAGIWNQSFAGQAQVCDYNNLDHPTALTAFAWEVEHPAAGCPSEPGLPTPSPWNP